MAIEYGETTPILMNKFETRDRINLNHSTMVEGVLFNIGFNV